MSEKTAKEARREHKIVCPNLTCPSNQEGTGYPEKVYGLFLVFRVPNSNGEGGLKVNICGDCGFLWAPPLALEGLAKATERHRILVPRPVVSKLGGLIKAAK
jgi:hypothetical protein